VRKEKKKLKRQSNQRKPEIQARQRFLQKTKKQHQEAK
jgi:hypothetical protein